MKEFVIRMFGESITERMNELGMTKTALIKQAEISMDTLNRAIKGKVSANVDSRWYLLCVVCRRYRKSRLLGNRLLQPEIR